MGAILYLKCIEIKTFIYGISNKYISILTPKGNLIEDINKGITDKN